MKKNNLDLLKTYFKEDSPGVLIISKINEGVDIFYNHLIYYFIKKNNITLVKDELNNNVHEDLFNDKEVHLFPDGKADIIKKALSNKINAIIFTDYKNFKKFSPGRDRFNSYNYQNDINYYIKYELDIHEEDLISYCTLNPQLVYSETSKFLINQNYIREAFEYKKINSIYDIRKKIFDLKKFNNNAREIYLEIKKEAFLKKVNFLTYWL